MCRRARATSGAVAGYMESAPCFCVCGSMKDAPYRRSLHLFPLLSFAMSNWPVRLPALYLGSDKYGISINFRITCLPDRKISRHEVRLAHLEKVNVLHARWFQSQAHILISAHFTLSRHPRPSCPSKPSPKILTLHGPDIPRKTNTLSFPLSPPQRKRG